MAALTSAQIINEINTNFVTPLATAGAAGAAAAFNSTTFRNAIASNAAAIAGVIAANAALGAGVAPAAVPAPAGYTQVSIAAGLTEPSGLAIAAGDLRTLVQSLAAKEVLNAKTNKLIYHVPKSDEILRRCVTTLYSKSKGVDIYNAPVAAAGALPPIPANYLPTMSGDLVDSMPKSEGDVYISLLNITPTQKEQLKQYDERVEKIRDVLSEGISAAATSIKPANVISGVSRNSVSVFSSYPPGLQEVLKERRKSDPSNPLNVAATLNRIRVSMNGGANNMIGGNASKAAPLYPRFVMHGGAHPLAVMEGGAAPGAGLAAPGNPVAIWGVGAAAAGAAGAAAARASPNPVAVLDARIRELEEQFKTATGSQGLAGQLSTQIRGYATSVNDNIRDLQQSLKELSEANAALAQYPVGLGMDASTFDGNKLRSLSAQADKINKDAAKASKQLDKLEQIKNTLEDLVNKSTPVGRA